MATTELTHIQPTTAGEKLRLILDAGASRVAALWHAARNRRSVNRLLEWDDRMLRDIGITQGDVRSALASRVPEDPSFRLRALSRERRSALVQSAHERAIRRTRGGLEI